MIDQSICLPFRIPHLYRGFAEVQGILRNGKDALVLDFEMKESLLDLVSLATKVVTIPLAEIAGFELQKGLFGRWLVIAVNSLQASREVPGSKAGEIRLKIARKNTGLAEEFVSRIRMALTTCGLKKLINDLNDKSATLHPRGSPQRGP